MTEGGFSSCDDNRECKDKSCRLLDHPTSPGDWIAFQPNNASQYCAPFATFETFPISALFLIIASASVLLLVVMQIYTVCQLSDPNTPKQSWRGEAAQYDRDSIILDELVVLDRVQALNNPVTADAAEEDDQPPADERPWMPLIVLSGIISSAVVTACALHLSTSQLPVVELVPTMLICFYAGFQGLFIILVHISPQEKQRAAHL